MTIGRALDPTLAYALLRNGAAGKILQTIGLKRIITLPLVTRVGVNTDFLGAGLLDKPGNMLLTMNAITALRHVRFNGSSSSPHQLLSCTGSLIELCMSSTTIDLVGQRRMSRRIPRLPRRLRLGLQLALHRDQRLRLCLPRLSWQDQSVGFQLDAVPRVLGRRRRERGRDRHREG